jgi:calpain-15
VTPLWKEIVWRRPTDILARDEAIPPGAVAHVFSGGVEPDDIKQGELGDCYLLSALSVLAEAENAVEALFVKGKESDEHGVYVVRLCIQGHWRSIVLDEQLPCFPDMQQRGQPVFSRGKGPELWVMLVEKAWAKVHGSYQTIVSGLPGECLTNLTGAPCSFLPHDDAALWEKVYEATTNDPAFTSKGWFVVALLPSDPEYDLEVLGLVAGHAYGVLDARQLAAPTPGAPPIHLLQLRNPWGSFEWTGDYGPTSALWTPEVRAQMVGVPADAPEDGSFWMTVQDFAKYFAGVQICRASRGWHHTSEDIRVRPGIVSVLTLTVHGDAPVTLDVCVHQADRRMHASKPGFSDDTFEYLGVRIMVMHAESGEVLQHWPLTQQRDVWCEVKGLAPGKYWVTVETDWDGSARPDVVTPARGDAYVTLGACTLSNGVVELLAPSHCPTIDGATIKEASLRYMCSAVSAAADTITYDMLFPAAARHASKISKVRAARARVAPRLSKY